MVWILVMNPGKFGGSELTDVFLQANGLLTWSGRLERIV